MSDKTTRRMIEAYYQDSSPTMFLTGFFRSPPQNFYNSEEVELDIVRGSEKVAIVVQDLSAGYRLNTIDDYTNKSFKAPVLKESFPIKASDLIKRVPGNDPFQDVSFQANAQARAFRGFRMVEDKIRRNMELQASQILQTGILTLIDGNGTALYSLDYKPKSTHFPTSSIAWGAANADPLGDLNSLANVIRSDGLATGGRFITIMGDASWLEFIKDTTVQAIWNTMNFDFGAIGRMEAAGGAGGLYQGTIRIGSYMHDLWLYDGQYEHPQTSAKTKFIGGDKVVMIASGARFDATFGSIPRFVPPDSRLLPFMPGRMSDGGRRMDLFTNAWISPDGENLFGGVGARPLLIPTAIDQYGCLDTGV